MTLYDILVKLATDSYDKIHIDLVKKNLRVGKKLIIENGDLTQHKIKVGDDKYDWEHLLTLEQCRSLDELYADYKYSVPSERDNGKHYFKALSANELSDAQLVCNMPRLEARVRLEAYILLACMAGYIHWDRPEKFYWQGKDKDFVILRKYL